MIGARWRWFWPLVVAMAWLIAAPALAQPVEESAPLERGRLEIRASETGARVTIDGTVRGLTPLAGLELTVGEHLLQVAKAGYAPFEQRITISAEAPVVVDVRLEPLADTGRLRVTIEGEPEMRVILDGRDVGPAPWEGEVSAGPHQVAGRSATARAKAIAVEVAIGETATVELAAERVGTLEVRVEGGAGTITLDGETVGEGRFRDELAEGPHEVRVVREGYEPFEKTIVVVAGDVHVETVNLGKVAAGQLESDALASTESFDGVYGGLQLIGMFEPTGSGHTLEESCDAVGATSCEPGMPLGGGLGGYIGYAFAPVGLELLLLAAGDVVEPSASFDGLTGTTINPLVASPAREESFIIGRFGGGGAFRLRVLHPIDRFRITGALGAGLVYRHLLLGRDTVSDEGQTSSVAPEGKGYFSAALSLELAGQVLLGGSTSLALGFQMWVEHAGSDVATEPEGEVYLAGGDGPPRPQATPSYDLALGTQLFLGPFLGLHFGP